MRRNCDNSEADSRALLLTVFIKKQVGALLAALARRRTSYREDWLILVSTDHGRTDGGGHGGESDLESRIFVLASGRSVQRGRIESPVGIVDVAVTALRHLGVPIDPSWQLDGKPVGSAVATP